LLKIVELIKTSLTHTSPEKGDQALVAIIDEGIDPLHSAFLDANQETRIIAIWDQTDNTGPSPEIPGVQTFGREYKKEEINRCIRENTIPNLERIPQKQIHGTHVASIAVGSRTGDFSGISPESGIIIVIPEITYDRVDKPGFSHACNLALIYIKYLAEQENLPVVVNISQGMNSGAHDGTALIERGCDNFSDGGKAPGLVIVKSAGNERDKKRHAKLFIFDNSSDTLCWQSPRNQDIIELWFKSSNLMRFRLTNPDEEASSWVTSDINEPEVYEFNTGDSCRIAHDSYPYNENSKLSIMVTTNQVKATKLAIWKLDIESIVVPYPSDIHAWIQHVDSQSIRVRERFTEFIDHIDEEITLTIPGTAKTIISVGSVNQSENFAIAVYSSLGPTRDIRQINQPILAAPGERIQAAQSGTSNDLCASSGTSMAAPHVTGAIALLLSTRRKQCASNPDLKQLNTFQIQQMIAETAHSPDGIWHQGKGYGVLNIEALLQGIN
jgi:subtilisin family serine protease